MAGSLASEDAAVYRYLWHGTLCEGRILFSRPRALGCAGWWTETCAMRREITWFAAADGYRKALYRMIRIVV